MATSLMQFGGLIDRSKGVGLMMYLVEKGEDWEKYHGPDSYEPNPNATTFCDEVEHFEAIDPRTGEMRKFIQLHRCWRVPCAQIGCWVGFRYNGSMHYPDLSVPIRVMKMPRDAEKIPADECVKYWTTP